MDRGWFKLWRLLDETPFWTNPEMVHTFLGCLIKAAWQEKDAGARNGFEKINLRPGQFVTGRESFTTYLYKDRTNKPSSQTVWNRISLLQKLGFLCIESCNKYSIITITNWDTYQSDQKENLQQNLQATCSKTCKPLASDLHKEEVKKERSKEEKKKEKDLKPFLSAQPPADDSRIFPPPLFQDDPEPLVGEIVEDVKPVKVKVQRKAKEERPTLDQKTLNEIILSWNEILPKLRTVTTLEGTRRRNFEKRWFEQWAGGYEGEPTRQTVEWWRWFFTEISKIPGLLGENRTGWKLTFDWMVSPFNFKTKEDEFRKIYEQIGEPKQDAGQKLRAGLNPKMAASYARIEKAKREEEERKNGEV